MTSLVLAVDPLLPASSGARLRVLHLARALANGLDGGVVVGTPDGGDAVAPEALQVESTGSHREPIPSLVRSVSQPYQAAKLNVPAAGRLASSRTWDVIQCPIFLLPSALRSSAPVVVDAYDIESETLASMAEHEGSALRRARWRWEARKTAAFERRHLPRAAAVCTTSDADAAAIEDRGVSAVTVVPNGVDAEATRHQLPASGHSMLFVGSFDYRPNVDAATELARDVLPRVRRDIPGADLVVVGRGSEALAPLATSAGVTVAGTVPEVLPYLHGARVLVVPLRSGSGTRLKVLEAMAAGVPVVSTRFGVAGIDVVEGRHVLLADDAAGLAAATARVLADDGLARHLSLEARSLAESRYDWRVVAAPLIELHRRLAER